MVKNDQNSRNGQKISKWTIWSKMVKNGQNGKNTKLYDFAKNSMLASQFARFAQQTKVILMQLNDKSVSH